MTNWKLREFLNSRGVKSASQARRMIEEATTYPLSKQAMCNLMNGDLAMLRLETAAAICNTFYCRLSDFCEIVPRDANTYQKNMATPLKRANNHKRKNSSDQSEAVDFAEFFPDARTFSSQTPLSRKPNGPKTCR